MDYYAEVGKLLSVNGSQDIEKVTGDIVTALAVSPGRPRPPRPTEARVKPR
jgi:hypothetical protein